jgi:hypothetical protein
VTADWRQSATCASDGSAKRIVRAMFPLISPVPCPVRHDERVVDARPMTINRFPFVDATYAAELLGVQPADILDWIAAGRLQTFGGKERNPFVRTAQVEELARELGRDINQPPAKKRASQDPVRRIELRLRHDSRWTDVTDADLQSWARGLDSYSRAAARQVATTALDRLKHVLAIVGSNSEDVG